MCRWYEPGDLDADTKSFFDLDETGVASVFNLNFMGILIPTQAFARDMVTREGCNILNISSMNAYTPLTKIPAYSGAKAAVSNLTQWLAVHFSKANIRVNAIAPGFFSGKQNAQLLWNADAEGYADNKRSDPGADAEIGEDAFKRSEIHGECSGRSDTGHHLVSGNAERGHEHQGCKRAECGYHKRVFTADCGRRGCEQLHGNFIQGLHAGFRKGE